jgi:hypothetical protein
VAHKDEIDRGFSEERVFYTGLKTGSEYWVSRREIVTAFEPPGILEAAEGDSACLIHQSIKLNHFNVPN